MAEWLLAKKQQLADLNKAKPKPVKPVERILKLVKEVKQEEKEEERYVQANTARRIQCKDRGWQCCKKSILERNYTTGLKSTQLVRFQYTGEKSNLGRNYTTR